MMVSVWSQKHLTCTSGNIQQIEAARVTPHVCTYKLAEDLKPGCTYMYTMQSVAVAS